MTSVRFPSPARRLARRPDQRRWVITPQESRFVEEYLVDLDPGASAVRVGLQPSRGTQLLANPRIQQAIALAKRRRSSRTEIYADYALQRIEGVAAADPREIAEIRRVNCRHCYGIDHEYQFNILEYRHALREHRAQQMLLPERDRVPFDERGGSGFKKYADPNPDCPGCDGVGMLDILIKDSRHYSPSALLLYDGIKYGAGGTVEVKLRDRSWADTLLLRHAAPRQPISEFHVGRMTIDQLDGVVMSAVEHGAITFEELDDTPDEEIIPDHSESITDAEFVDSPRDEPE